MAASGDVLELQLRASYVGETILNVFHYRIEDAPTAGVLTGLEDQFEIDVLPSIRAVVNTGTVFNFIAIRNIFNVAEIRETSINLAGTGPSTANNSASFLAWYYKLVRGNASVRNGRKMFGALNDVMMNGNNAHSTMNTALNTLATKLSMTLVPGGVDNLKPVIVGRVPYTTSQGRPAYRLPASQAEMASNGWAYVTSAQFKQLSTMNTRKHWRGI